MPPRPGPELQTTLYGGFSWTPATRSLRVCTTFAGSQQMRHGHNLNHHHGDVVTYHEPSIRITSVARTGSVMRSGGGKPRRSSRAARDAAATEAEHGGETADSVEYADQNEDSGSLPGAGTRGKKQSNGRRWDAPLCRPLVLRPVNSCPTRNPRMHPQAT